MRRLKDIALLSRSAPLASHVEPISEAGLSEIESGKSMPSLATIQTLAMVYRVSVRQLLGYIAEERLRSTSATAAPDARDNFAALLSAGQWSEALQVASAGETTASSEAARISWRANRALCLSRMGQFEESVMMLLECIESPALRGGTRHAVLRCLAECMAAAGRHQAAGMTFRAASDLAAAQSADVQALDRAAAEISRIGNLVMLHASGQPQPEPALRAAQRDLERLTREWPSEDVHEHLRLRLTDAELHLCLGNRLVALRDAAAVRTDARSASSHLVEGQSLCVMGRIHEQQSARRDAEECYEAAARLSLAGGHLDLEFESIFRLYLLRKDSRPGKATKDLQRCGVLYPLLPSLTPTAKEYEAVIRGRA